MQASQPSKTAKTAKTANISIKPRRCSEAYVSRKDEFAIVGDRAPIISKNGHIS